MFRKSFLKIAIVGTGTMLSAGFGFLYLSAVAKTLPVEEFGKYALLVSLLLSISKILDFGTNSLYVARSIETKDKRLTNYFISNKFVQFAVSLPIALIILWAMGLATTQVITTFLIGLIFYGASYTMYGIFQEVENYVMVVALFAIPAVIKGVFGAALLLNWISLSYSQNFLVFALSIGPSLLCYFALPKDKRTFSFDFSKTKSFLKKTLSPGLSQVFIEGFPAVANSLAKAFLGFTNLGIYAIADKISSAFVLISFSVFTVLLPKNAARKREKKGYDYNEALVLSLGVLVLSVVAFFAGKLFIPWFFGTKYLESINILGLLILSGALGSIHMFMENYFYVEQKTKYLAFFSGGKIGLLILLTMILTPMYELKGLATAHFTSSLFTTSLVFLTIYKRRKKCNTH